MLYNDTTNPGNLGMQFIPSWYEAQVNDLRIQIVLPPNVTASEVKTTQSLLEQHSKRRRQPNSLLGKTEPYTKRAVPHRHIVPSRIPSRLRAATTTHRRHVWNLRLHRHRRRSRHTRNNSRSFRCSKKTLHHPTTQHGNPRHKTRINRSRSLLPA